MTSKPIHLLSRLSVFLRFCVLYFISKYQSLSSLRTKENQTNRFLSWLKHFVTTARIHVFSSASVASPGFPAGGWKATFLPSCNGSCLASASFRAFGSRENGVAAEGPTELRSATPEDTGRLMGVGMGVEGKVEEELGDKPRGRLFLFSGARVDWRVESDCDEWLTWSFRCISQRDQDVKGFESVIYRSVESRSDKRL